MQLLGDFELCVILVEEEGLCRLTGPPTSVPFWCSSASVVGVW